MIKVNIPAETAAAAAWGDITGTLSDQTDLNQALSDIATVNVTSPISGDGTSLSPLDISINGLPQKSVLADNDLILIEDSADSYNPKKVLKSALAGSGGLTNFTESNYLYSTKYGVKLTPNLAQTNVDVVLQPKGDGGILAQQPTGTATGGNNRGANAVDLQTIRAVNTQVASGSYSGILSGASNTASSAFSVVVSGTENIGSASNTAIVNGYQCQASSQYSTIANGYKVKSSNEYTFVGASYGGNAYLLGQGILVSYNVAPRARQSSELTMQRTTTNTTETEMFLDNSSARAVLKNNQKWGFIVNIVASEREFVNYAYFTRRGIIRRGENAADTVISALDTIGTDFNTLGGGSIAITADTTNGSLKIAVAGVGTKTIYWQAKIELVEIQN